MNIFKQFIKSLYSPKDIALFRFQGIGKTILYVFFLTLLSIIPSAYFFSTAIATGIDAAKTAINEQFPEFEIDNGELRADQTAPLTINQDGFAIIFDSTGTVKEEDLANTDNAVAFLRNDFFFIAGGQIQSYPYTMFAFPITNTNVLEVLNTLDSITGIMIAILIISFYVFSTGIKFVEVTFLAMIGLFLKNMAGRKLQYRHLWRMAAYCVTLPTIFFTIMAALKTSVPNGFLINWFVALVVLSLAIKEIPKPKQN